MGAASALITEGGIGELLPAAGARGEGLAAHTGVAWVPGEALVGPLNPSGGPVGKPPGCDGTLGKQARSEQLGVGKTRARNLARGAGRHSPVVEDTVFVPMEARDGGALDLTVREMEVRRYCKGRWSAVADREGRAVLSRVVTTEELARNTGRIPADGLCGYLALQWAASGVAYASEWAELRVVENRERLCRFLGRPVGGV